jgi:hypothetical protein
VLFVGSAIGELIGYLILQDAGIGGSPNKEDLATATPDQELDAGTPGVPLLALVLLCFMFQRKRLA